MTHDDDLAVVRAAAERFVAGDFERLGEMYTPDAVLSPPEGWPESERERGRDAIVRQFRRLQEDWSSQAMHVEHEASVPPWVVVRQVWDVEGRVSGARMRMEIFAAYRVEGHRIAEARFSWDRDDALRAAGA